MSWCPVAAGDADYKHLQLVSQATNKSSCGWDCEWLLPPFCNFHSTLTFRLQSANTMGLMVAMVGLLLEDYLTFPHTSPVPGSLRYCPPDKHACHPFPTTKALLLMSLSSASSFIPALA